MNPFEEREYDMISVMDLQDKATTLMEQLKDLKEKDSTGENARRKVVIWLFLAA